MGPGGSVKPLLQADLSGLIEFLSKNSFGMFFRREAAEKTPQELIFG
jgi:hypothetical protein